MSGFIISPHPRFHSTKRSRSIFSSCHPHLERAIHAGHILDIGRSVQLRRNGTISAPQLLETAITAPWDVVVERCVGELCGGGGKGKGVHAIYVRGSVAAGHAFVDGRSDIDFVVLTHGDVGGTKATARGLGARIRAAHPFVRRVDITWYDLRRGLSQSLRFQLVAYCILVHGVDIRPQLLQVAPAPSPHLYNVRNDMRVACAREAAVQRWFLKRVLRGLVDCVAGEQRRHARDVVPCARILCAARPHLAHLAVQAAVAACGGNKSVVDVDILADVTDWVEIELLKHQFGACPPSLVFAPPPPPPPSPPVPTTLGTLRQHVEEGAFRLGELLRGPPAPASSPPFIRDALRPVVIDGMRPVQEMSAMSLHDAMADFEHRTQPTVYRAAVTNASNVPLDDTKALMATLCADARMHDVRIARGCSFTYCRLPDTDADAVGFEAPSEVRRMTAREFFARARGERKPLRYPDERVYLQSACVAARRLVPLVAGTALRQPERWWVCTHGAVSPLHYDAAHSVLVQLCGTKRMVLFPPAALETMGVYPLGHPLHRRAMVDLARPHSALFADFWTKHASNGQEVVLRPGDALLFPAFWAHHTESSANANIDGLCAARTLRFVYS